MSQKCVDCGKNTTTIDDKEKVYRCLPCILEPICRDIMLTSRRICYMERRFGIGRKRL